MNTYKQALTIAGTTSDALDALKEADIKAWAKCSQTVEDLMCSTTYRFQTDETRNGERILWISIPKFHPSSRHYGKKFGDRIHFSLINECGAEISWDGYCVPERSAAKAKNTIWLILAENEALDLLP